MTTYPTGAAKVAGVVGQPIRHSLSPFLHTAWLQDLRLDGVYAPFSPPDTHNFQRLIQSCRSNGIKGLNITAPFKEEALKLADTRSQTAEAAGSANLLTFSEDGAVHADSTDGFGLMRAFDIAAPGHRICEAPVVIMGAGGAARAAVAALKARGCPQVRVVNRTLARAEDLVFAFGDGVTAYDLSGSDRAFEDAAAVINAASGGPLPPLEALPDYAVVMDMTYRPLMTAWLTAAAARGLGTVDGLHMLIEQARPSFEAFFGTAPNPDFDIRARVLAHLEPQA